MISSDVIYGGTTTSSFINGNMCSMFFESVPNTPLILTSDVDIDSESMEISIEY